MNISILVSKIPDVPIGTILAWVLRVDNDTSAETVDLPDGWMVCDGSVIPDGSIWSGKLVPDLNGKRRFLRGGSDDMVLTLEDDQIMEHTHILNDPSHSHSYIDKHYSRDHEAKGPTDHDTGYDQYNEPHTRTSDSASTGITITGVSSDYNHGEENRPKNMGVIWIIRVW